ncbi:MAG: 3-deoxy-D-manno-octulosonic acid transferase [Bacteroidales bacterium]|nr:3-deoxy-D-manno-octulosonic acid transferase [Bacteroidales bacterium]
MRILISIGIALYTFGIAVASLFNEKARLWIKGRKDIFQKLADTFEGTEHPVWIHSASLGEYEQARPLIEKIKKESPETKIIATFFSPSGYEIRKNDKLPDYVFYLPADTMRNAKRFVRIVNPQMAIFVKYEFWFNYIHELHQNQIPFYYVSAIFRPSQYFFKPIGKWFAKQLQQAAGFFVQNELSKQLLHSIDIHQVEVCGDTRFDRVYAISQQSYSLDFIENFKQDKKLIVAGSSWGPDEMLLAQLLVQLQGYKLVVAPHELNRKAEVMATFQNFRTMAYTEMDGCDLADYDVLVIDTIGILSKIYKYSTVSYIGGAFKTGLHNILEAGVFGVPLFFGPHYSKFNEAVMLVQQKGAFSITTAAEMLAVLQHFDSTPAYYEETCRICKQYVEDNIGAVDKIYSGICKI